jgi:hypothetical protein
LRRVILGFCLTGLNSFYSLLLFFILFSEFLPGLVKMKNLTPVVKIFFN